MNLSRYTALSGVAVGCVLVLLLALVMFPSSSWASSITIGGVGSGGTQAIRTACIADISDCSFVDIIEEVFEAQSPAQLVAAYDVLLFGWQSPATLDADWFTRLKPYMEGGGSIIFESPLNLSDLSPLASGFPYEYADAFVSASIPILTDGINSSFVNSHMEFTAWSPVGLCLVQSLQTNETGPGPVAFVAEKTPFG